MIDNKLLVKIDMMIIIFPKIEQGERLELWKRYGYAKLIAYSLLVASQVLKDEPSSASSALASKTKTQWLDTMNEEMKSLHLNNT